MIDGVVQNVQQKSPLQDSPSTEDAPPNVVVDQNSQDVLSSEGAPSNVDSPSIVHASLDENPSVVDGLDTTKDDSLDPSSKADETLDDMIASAGTNIADVLTSVEEDFGKSDEHVDDMEEELLGSLELSVSPSQSVDDTKPVTQLSDVREQLAAEEKKVAEKKICAYQRRRDSTAEVAPDDVVLVMLILIF